MQFLSHCRIFGSRSQNSYLSDFEHVQKGRPEWAVCLCVTALHKSEHECKCDRMHFKQERRTKEEREREKRYSAASVHSGPDTRVSHVEEH